MKTFLIGDLSRKPLAYTALHDRYYGSLLDPLERTSAEGTHKLYREQGLVSINSPRTGIVDRYHFTDCILEEYLRRPQYFQDFFLEGQLEDLWKYFRPLWHWYFPFRVEALLEIPLLKGSFPQYCNELWENNVHPR